MPGRVSHIIRRGWQRRGWLNRLLYPLSLGYAGLMTARRRAYHAGVFKRHRLPLPVVVVGNLSVGGAGKTPLLMALADELKRRGMSPGVISRGYRGRADSWPREVGESTTAGEVGDEPVLIFRRCRVPVAVGPERTDSARLLIDKHPCDIILSDDGFQHLALRRDLDIVVIDCERGFGNGWCLPAGPLREPAGALEHAGMVVVHGADGPGRAGEFAPGAFTMETRIDHATPLGGGRPRALRAFAGNTVHALAGTGNPGRFFRQLAEFGIDVIPHEFPDHHAFTPADLDFAEAGRDAVVLMTEKDAVKCENPPADRQYWVVPLRVTLDPELVTEVLKRLSSCRRFTS